MTNTYPETYILPDASQAHDHMGEAVAPLTSTARHFTYAIRQANHQRTIYATNAHGILAVLIDDYDPRDLGGTDPAADRELTDTRTEQRARHAYGIAVNHVAQAILLGAPDDIVATLKRSTDYTRPLSHAELPEWNHEIPLLLIDVFYGPGQTQPPAGNVIMLRVDDADDYLHDLARAGRIHLLEHCSATTAPVRVMVDLDPDPTTTLQARLDDLDQAVQALRATPNDTNAALVRERTQALGDVLHTVRGRSGGDAAALVPIGIDAEGRTLYWDPAHDVMADVQRRLERDDSHQALSRITNRYLVKRLRQDIAPRTEENDA